MVGQRLAHGGGDDVAQRRVLHLLQARRRVCGQLDGSRDTARWGLLRALGHCAGAEPNRADPEPALPEPVHDLVRQERQLLRPHRRGHHDGEHATVEVTGRAALSDAVAGNFSPGLVIQGHARASRGRVPGLCQELTEWLRPLLAGRGAPHHGRGKLARSAQAERVAEGRVLSADGQEPVLRIGGE